MLSGGSTNFGLCFLLFFSCLYILKKIWPDPGTFFSSNSASSNECASGVAGKLSFTIDCWLASSPDSIFHWPEHFLHGNQILLNTVSLWNTSQCRKKCNLHCHFIPPSKHALILGGLENTSNCNSLQRGESSNSS